MDFDRTEIGGNRLPRGHVLLISPLTFSYHLTISAALRSMGYEVTWWDERASSATLYKIALRLFPTATVKWSERRFSNQLEQLDDSRFTHVLVIKGEGLSRWIVKEIRKKLYLASMGLYLWDGIENIKGVSKIWQEFDSVATFDPFDAKTYGWTYRPLFGRSVSASVGAQQVTQYDWSFIGTIHSDRHRVIHRLRKRYGASSRNFVYCYFQSPLMLFIRRLLDWTLWLAPKGTLSTKSMSAKDVSQIVASSGSVLDIEHPKQRGFTMRTIETILAGKKLVTTNELIYQSDLYHPSRVCVINRDRPEISVEFLNKSYLPVAENIRSKYSCEGWVTELLSFQDHAKAVRQGLITTGNVP
jgi:hypothetical protein